MAYILHHQQLMLVLLELVEKTKKSILQQIADIFNQPDEHADIKPTNTETTISIAQALRVYDCYIYGYNCNYTP